MATTTINGQELEIEDDERLNGIQAAKRVGEEIHRGSSTRCVPSGHGGYGSSIRAFIR